LAATGDLEERPELLAALAATGIEEDAVRFIPLPLSGLGTEAIAVDVGVELVQDVSPEIVDAVEELRGSTGDTGVLFSSSTCPQLLLEAQQEAVADAEERMAALAAAADIELGALTEVVEISGGGFVATEADLLAAGTITGDEPCDPDAIIAGLDPYGGAGQLKPLDAEPETSVSSVVVLGRAAG
jgi:Protein of unknown function (DUF541)